MTATATTKTSTWAIDASHTNVEFAVKHMMISTVKGSFSDVSGEIILDEENFENSKVWVEIGVASITTRDEKRDEHLRSADFFNAEKYPKMRFVSTAVKPGKGDEFTVIGDLTIMETTMPVEIRAEKTGVGTSPWGQTVMGFVGNTKINRKDFGLTWNVALETGGVLVGDEIRIHLEVEAIKQ